MHTSIFIMAFLVLGSIGFIALKSINEDAMQRTIRRDLADLHDWYNESGLHGLQSALEDRAAYADLDAFYALNANGKSYQVPSNIPTPLYQIAQPGWHDFNVSVNHIERSAVARVVLLPDGSRLLVGHIAWERERLFSAMKNELWIGLLLVILIAALLAYVMIRAIAHALEEPLAVAKSFADGNRKARVHPNGSHDSFHQLALHLNAMFARIEDLVSGIAHTTDAIAHDLRTPLTRLKTQLEEAKTVAQNPQARQQIEAALSEADRLLTIFQAMLRLARLEADKHHPNEPVLLNELVQDAADMFEAVAESEGQHFSLKLPDINSAIIVPGDRDQLFQLLVNLLDNAIKYAHQGSHVGLTLSLQGAYAKISVFDDGPGIPAKDIDRVFDRFVRLESHRGSPGNGLGLPLVRAIVRHHQGHIRLEEANPGLRVVIELPLNPSLHS